MPNQTIIAVPVDVAEPQVLKRFLTRLIEELDLVLGFRGEDPYVSQSDLSGIRDTATTIVDLARAATANASSIAEVAEDLAELAETVQSNTDQIGVLGSTLAHVDLDGTYHDLNASVYASLQGRATFSTVGSNISNAPFAVVAGYTYYCFFNAATTNNGGNVQELCVYNDTTGVPEKYVRFGDTSTDLFANGWIAI